jgi:branched-chain amino acid transport system substrate-binding protein
VICALQWEKNEKIAILGLAAASLLALAACGSAPGASKK